MAREAVTVKEAQEQEGDGVYTLSTGYRARIPGVSQAVIQDALALLEEPSVPMWYNEEKQKDEPNPVDPDYLRDLRKYGSRQYKVTFDCFAMFGVELIDGLPEDDSWIQKLRLMEMRGHLSLADFDLENAIHLDFLFKRYIAMRNDDYILVGRLSGIDEGGIRAAARSFPGTETRGSDRNATGEGD